MRLSLAQKIRRRPICLVVSCLAEDRKGWKRRWKRQEEGGRGRKRSQANSCLGLWAENAELYSHFVDLPRGQFPCEFIKYIPSMTYISSIVIVIIVVSWMMVNGKGHEENGRLFMEISLSRVVALRNPVECCNG